MTCLRAIRTFSLFVFTSMPSETGVAQEAANKAGTFYFDYANAAIAGYAQVGVIAKGWNSKIQTFGCFQDGGAFFNLYRVLFIFRLTIYLLMVLFSYLMGLKELD